MANPADRQTTVWRPIETAPRDGTEFLAATNHGRVMVLSAPQSAAHGARYLWWRVSGRDGAIPIEDTHAPGSFKPDATLATHWMPLPEPPLP